MPILRNLVSGHGKQKPVNAIYNGFDWLPNRSSARSLGLTILGARGSGKSFPTFKELSWGDLLTGIPQLILDPVGSSAYLLDKLWRARSTLPLAAWQKLASKIVYLDFGATQQRVPEWPLIFHWEHESHYQAAQRPIDLIAGLDVELASAAIEGLNAIRSLGAHTFVILSILGLQLTEAHVLLTQTKQCDREWGWFDEAIRREPMEATVSVSFFREQYMKWKPDIQDRRTKSLLNQIQMVHLDPVMRAMFGSERVPPWQQWEAGSCVIAQFQGIRDLDRRRWCMMAVYDQFVAYKLSRGLRSPPWSLVLEELTQWVPSGTNGEMMAAKLDTLLNVYARNYQIYVTTISQELFQMPPRLQEVLLTAGNLMIGSQSSGEGRKRLAEYFFPYIGQELPPKRLEKVYQGEDVIDYRPGDYSLAEYAAVTSQAFVLPGWHFWVKKARKEGDSTGGLEPMIVQRNRGEWVQEDEVSVLRNVLIARSCRPQSQILAEIEARLGPRIDQSNPVAMIKPDETEESALLSSEDTVSTPELPDLPPGVEVIAGGFQPGRTRKGG